MYEPRASNFSNSERQWQKGFSIGYGMFRECHPPKLPAVISNLLRKGRRATWNEAAAGFYEGWLAAKADLREEGSGMFWSAIANFEAAQKELPLDV